MPSTLRADLAHRAWAPTPLPGTRQEAEAIQRLLPQAQLFLGPEATKERLLHLPPPGILHLATHGFFLEDEPEPTDSRAIVHFGALGEDSLAASPPDPLLWGTQLVVLSACDTGRGDVKLGQGVYGLRRAFLHPHYWAPFIDMGRETPLRLQPQ